MGHKQPIDLSKYHDIEYGNKGLSDDVVYEYAEKAIEHDTLDKRVRNTVKVVMLRVAGILIAAVLMLGIIWPDLARAFMSTLGFSIWEAKPPEGYTGSMWMSYGELEYVESKDNAGMIETIFIYGDQEIHTFEMPLDMLLSFDHYRDTNKGQHDILKLSGELACEYWHDDTGSIASITGQHAALVVCADSIPLGEYIKILSSVKVNND